MASQVFRLSDKLIFYRSLNRVTKNTLEMKRLTKEFFLGISNVTAQGCQNKSNTMKLCLGIIWAKQFETF
jgi:hypothetical protein